MKANNNIKTEILAPAGSIDTLYAGINAGADAIYIGGQKFGARAYADNPKDTDLMRAIDYVHMHGRKIYLTVNTLLKNEELTTQLYDYILPFYLQGLDAVIVQDIGVFQFIRDNFPGLDIHASTQMAVTGIEGARLLKTLGASRIVTARELSLTELRAIHENVDIEIESFIHGAMCYSYSGMCLFSSMIGGRSGNRGRCAGPCRQPYEVYNEKRLINHSNNMYALSLKDMNTIDIIPEIIDSGVFSLKIEGRMKSPEYAAGVVSIYRKYVDLYNEYGAEKYHIHQTDRDHLAGLYSRSGSTIGYYKCHNAKNMISYEKPAYKSDDDNFIAALNDRYCGHTMKRDCSAYVYIHPDEPVIMTISDKDCFVTIEGSPAGKALKRPLSMEDVRRQINKTGDSFLKFEEIVIDMSEDAFAPLSMLNDIRRRAVTEFEEKLLNTFRREGDSNGASDNAKNLLPDTRNHKNVNKPELTCQIQTLAQLRAILGFDEINDIYVSTDIMNITECIDAICLIIDCGKNCYLNMPFIFREKGIQYIKTLFDRLDKHYFNQLILSVRNIDEFGYIVNETITPDLSKRISEKSAFVIDNSLYAFNSYAKEFFYREGACHVTLPYEINQKELIRLADSRDELVVYGRIPLMISAGCTLKNYSTCTNKTNYKLSIKDRLGMSFPVVNCCNFCYNIIYNNIPMSLLALSDRLKSVKCGRLRLNFTLENETEVKEIAGQYIHTFCYGKPVCETGQYTRGHFNRGVE